MTILNSTKLFVSLALYKLSAGKTKPVAYPVLSDTIIDILFSTAEAYPNMTFLEALLIYPETLAPGC